MINRPFSFRPGLAAGALLLIGACSTTADNPPALVEDPTVPTAPVYFETDILGAEATSIDALLGAPTLTRQEGDGEYRRYALSSCTLIVILYPDEQGASRAVHLDAIAPNTDAEKPDLNACLAGG